MRPLRQAHPRRWSEAPAPDLRCPRDASRRDPAARRSEEGGADGQSPGEEAGGRGRKSRAPRPRLARRRRPRPPGPSRRADGHRPRRRRAARRQRAARQPPPPPRGRAPAKSQRARTITSTTSSSSAPARPARRVPTGWPTPAGTSWSVEKKVFPREKTCGDGLTPRAVRQLADMGLEGALAGSHRYTRPPGLRLRPIDRDAVARAPALPRLRLHHHPPRPRRPGGGPGRRGRSDPAAGHRGRRRGRRR